jgi:hypothetical protein
MSETIAVPKLDNHPSSCSEKHELCHAGFFWLFLEAIGSRETLDQFDVKDGKPWLSHEQVKRRYGVR